MINWGIYRITHLNWKPLFWHVDLESFEPEEINGELFFKVCAVQSRTEKSIDDLDKLEGYENGTATGGRVRGPEYRHMKKIYKNYGKSEVRFDS